MVLVVRMHGQMNDDNIRLSLLICLRSIASTSLSSYFVTAAAAAVDAAGEAANDEK